MKQSRLQALLSLLSEVNGATFISVDTLTDPIMNKTVNGRGSAPNPMYGRVKKAQTDSVVMAFQNKNVNGYEAMVKRRLIAEGKDPEFELSERRWGKRVPNMPLVIHEDQYYLEVIFLKPGPVQYFYDGMPINEDAIIGLRETVMAEQGGLSKSNKVQIRCIKFDNLKRIKIGGTTIEFN